MANNCQGKGIKTQTETRIQTAFISTATHVLLSEATLALRKRERFELCVPCWVYSRRIGQEISRFACAAPNAMPETGGTELSPSGWLTLSPCKLANRAR
jgi:hypothetical protein